MKNEYYVEGEIAIISLTLEQVCRISATDLPLVAPYRWYAHRQANGNYAVTHETGSHATISMHRRIVHPPENYWVDHINGDTLDNRRENLRIVTPAQNAWNRTRHRNNHSGYRGVTYCKQTERWRAAILVDGKTRQLGRFTTREEAASAYNEAALTSRGDFITHRNLNMLSGSVL